MIENKGIIDKALYQKIKSTLVDKKIKFATFGFAAAFLICAIFVGDLLLSAIWIVGAVIMATETLVLQKKAIKLSLGRLKERVGSESVQVTNKFLEDGIEITYEGETTETVAVKYEHFCALIRHKAAYILRTEFRQAVIIFRENMTEEEEQTLFAFLKTKPTKIKWK